MLEAPARGRSQGKRQVGVKKKSKTGPRRRFMTKCPYYLLMDDKLVDYFSSLDAAVAKAHEINKNRYRSSEGRKARQSIKIVYDTPQETRTVHEET